MHPIHIIGMGSVCSLGYGVDKAWNDLLQEQNGLKPISLFDPELKEIPLCGQVDVPPEEMLNCNIPNRTAGFAMWSAEESMRNIDKKNLRIGVVLATTVGGITNSELFYKKLKQNSDYIKNASAELTAHEPASVTGAIARHIGATGCHTISTACSTGLHAIGMAKRFIEKDIYDVCVAVGADALSVLTIRGFSSLMLVDFKGCKPFDKKRIGVSLGEGAGAITLASEKVAKKLSLTSNVKISGWGASADSYHMTAPHPEGLGAISSVKSALKEANLTTDKIDFIASHGTATPDNDVSEIKAMKSLFDPLPPFGSMKGTLGHTLAASGTLEAVFSVKILQTGNIPATVGYSDLDDEIGVSPTPFTQKNISHILKNSFGFGGNNASLILSRI